MAVEAKDGNEMSEWARRRGVFQPHEFSIFHEDHREDRAAWPRLARSWQDRQLREKLRALRDEHAELQGQINILCDHLRENEGRKFA